MGREEISKKEREMTEKRGRKREIRDVRERERK